MLKKGSKFKIILVIAIVILISVVWILSQSLFKDYPLKNNKTQLLAIEKGQTYSGFIDELSDKKIVHFAFVLKLYQRLMIDESLKAGVYEIHQGMSIREVLIMLSDANNAQMNRVVVIDGTTFKQLKSKLKADPFVTKTILDLSDEQIMQKIGAPYAHPEGLFAPNTYFFAKGETDVNILKNLYERQMKVLDTAWAKRDKDLPYQNKYDALIMASIIEKETSIASETRQVAGVFIRRLKIGMRLQTDPTVIYGMGEKYNGNITREDLRTPTAYNTYTINGLPPTPIAFAGQRAIEAAMHPDQSNHLYFVATGTGGHKFSTTLEQHNQAVRDYLTVLRQNRPSN